MYILINQYSVKFSGLNSNSKSALLKFFILNIENSNTINKLYSNPFLINLNILFLVLCYVENNLLLKRRNLHVLMTIT